MCLFAVDLICTIASPQNRPVSSNHAKQQQKTPQIYMTTHSSVHNKTAHESGTTKSSSFSQRQTSVNISFAKFLTCHCLHLPLLHTFSNKQQSAISARQINMKNNYD